MAYTDFIAAIDLGSSHMVGMVGTKGLSGTLSIIAYEVENSDTCIRRGCVYSIKETASKIKRIILKLENKLGGARISKVYIGVGGQSLRSIDHVVSKVLDNGIVTEETLQDLSKKCNLYRPDMLDVLKVVSPVYFLDNKQEENPVGISCSRLEARYKLIVGRPSLRHAVTMNIADQIGVKVVDVVVSPLALANLILTNKEKDQGCALVDFGGGVTSVSVFKNKHLVSLSVIPLGGDLITSDLMMLDMPEMEAERIKSTYGNALWEKDSDQESVSIDLADGQHTKEIKRSEINLIVEARVREIIENVYARLADAGVIKNLGSGMIIAGNGAALRNLREALTDRCKMDVRYASVRRDCIEAGEMIANNPEFTTAAALLFEGTENCAQQVFSESKVESKNEEFEETIYDPALEDIRLKEDEKQSENEKINEPDIKVEKEKTFSKAKKSKKEGLLIKIKNSIDNFGGELFSEDNNQ